MAARYVPDRGDVVWLQFDPQSGHEQAGRRPAVVLSPLAYNRKVGLALFCPVSSQAKGYPFEVLVPSGLPIHGAILSDQLRSLDWRVRKARRICKLPISVVDDVFSKVYTLIGR